jgi:hypothetical protein
MSSLRKSATRGGTSAPAFELHHITHLYYSCLRDGPSLNQRATTNHTIRAHHHLTMFKSVTSFFGGNGGKEDNPNNNKEAAAPPPKTTNPTTNKIPAAIATQATPTTTSVPTTNKHSRNNNVSFPSSEIYLKHRQQRTATMTEQQELSNRTASKLSKQAMALEKNMSMHASVIREFKSECARLPKASMTRLEDKVTHLLPAIQRIEAMLERWTMVQQTTAGGAPPQKVAPRNSKRLSFSSNFFNRNSSSPLSSPRNNTVKSRRNTVKIRGMSEDQFSEDMSDDIDCV